MRESSRGIESPHRKRFRIQSEFGLARQWRSRKSRPCDACRKRKSACVIEDRPPCLFCKRRDLTCQSTGEPRRRRESTNPESVQADEHLHQLEPAAETSRYEVAEAIDQSSQPEVDRSEPLYSPNTVAEDILVERNIMNDRQMPVSSSSEEVYGPTIHTLEDGIGKTAHSMGLSAEQDTHLLAAFRSVIIDESNRLSGDTMQVFSGNSVAGTPPVHFNILTDAFMPWDNQIRREASQKIERKVGSYGPDLVRLYFKFVHPVWCVVSKVRFLRAYKDDLLSIPASLRGAIYGMGAVYWDQDPVLRTVNRPFEQHELFHAARDSLERELDAPNLWKLQACLLMLHEKPGTNYTYETPRVWTLSAQAVACAQVIGLHRDPSEWNIAPWEKSLRKKLWYATYVADTWSSVAHGNPPHIYQAGYTTPDLNMEDLHFDEDVPEDLKDMVDPASTTSDVSTAARFVELVTLTKILHELLDTSFSDQNYRAATLDPAIQEAKVLSIKDKLGSWYSLIPQCVTMNYMTTRNGFRNNAPLHLAYFATQILLLRALMTPASREAKSSPDSSLRRFFGSAVDQLDTFLAFIDDVSLEQLQAFWGRHARSQLILIGNFFVYLFLLSSSPDQVRATFGLLERFHESLQKKCNLLDEGSVHLVRPVALRIDSFFTTTAQIMRNGLNAGAYSAERMSYSPS